MTAGGCAGGEVLPSFIGGGSRSTAQESEPAPPSNSNSANANFKAFAGRGTSIGGAPLVAAGSAPPRYDSQGASASRARSTPETRAAASAAASDANDNNAAGSGGAGGRRQGSALVAMLEAKKSGNRSTTDSSSALTTSEDVGHSMDPTSDGKHAVRKSDDDKDDGANYAGLNETEDSV